MATQSPISTISYNSESFLKEKLDLWVKQHIIQSYQYICHKGEDGDKDHIHLRVEPNKRIDPMDLSEALREYVGNNPKPLGVRPWRPSKEEDWYLYATHEPRYLKLKYGGGDKGEKLPYSYTDIVANEDYDVEIAFTRALAYMEHTTVNIATQIQGGAKPIDLILKGENPYIVNALMHSISHNDYMRLQDEYNELGDRFNRLLKDIYEHGYIVEEYNDGFKFIPISDKQTN